MNNIFDEAIEVLESSKSITGFSCDYPEAIKAIKLGKLYKELHTLIPYMPGLSDESKLRIKEINKEIEGLENEF